MKSSNSVLLREVLMEQEATDLETVKNERSRMAKLRTGEADSSERKSGERSKESKPPVEVKPEIHSLKTEQRPPSLKRRFPETVSIPGGSTKPKNEGDEKPFKLKKIEKKEPFESQNSSQGKESEKIRQSN